MDLVPAQRIWEAAEASDHMDGDNVLSWAYAASFGGLYLLPDLKHALCTDLPFFPAA